MEPRKGFAISWDVFENGSMNQPLALILYERLLPGTQLVNRLQDLQYRVHTINDIDALKPNARSLGPMLVLVDLEWSKGNIRDAISQLHQDPVTSHIPVIAFTREVTNDLEAAALQSGATLVASDNAVLNHLPQLLQQAIQDGP